MWKSSTTKQYWNVRVPAVVGSCNLVVKHWWLKPATRVRFLVLFYIPFSTCVSDVNRILGKGVLSMCTQSVRAKF